ncbi:MAG: cytochrome b [Legionellales bacterium]|nr:cytochrome b [Legionellales bacterium]OUX67041.1 MAG: cytochrome b [bacterium TMED178]
MRKLSLWVNQRLPISAFYKQHFKRFYVHTSLNFWYATGAIAFLVFAIQIFTGIFLMMYYIPTEDQAFSSVEMIMRDVNYGWLIRYMHVVGASSFFIIIYLHVWKALMYGSYKEPRELLWFSGVLVLILLMAVAFTGYVLPWGQMSYWASKVIISFVTVIPYVGESLAIWLQGDFTFSGVVIPRFYAYHVVALPLIIIFLIGIHIIALHVVGSNNPEGILINPHQQPKKHERSAIRPFSPYYIVKDYFAATVFLLIYFLIIFYFPTLNGFFLEHINQEPANMFVTPAQIHPVWYLAPYSSILRAVPSKGLGVFVMFAAILIFFFLPWLDRSPVRSIRYKGILSKLFLSLFLISVIGLGVLGLLKVTDDGLILTRIFTCGYFSYFLFMPFYTKLEKCTSPPCL